MSMPRIQPAQSGDPSRIGVYRIIGRLGSGGMGTVYAALTNSGERLALKVVHAAQAGDPEFRARFRREVALSRRVQGPCLVSLLDADTEAGKPWLATAYVPGPTLSEYVTAHGRLTGARLYAFAAGTAAALMAVHGFGVVHRDIKPGNVILAPDGPRVLDFGIAHTLDGTAVTRTGVMTGTPGWISPEHYRTGVAGPEGDVFAWGALIAYAASGRLPFGSGSPDVVAFRVLSEDPNLGDIPDVLRPLVGRALAKDPAERPSAATLVEECTKLLSAEATHVLDPAAAVAGAAPTLVADLVAAQWDMPTLDDSTWIVEQRRSSRRRTVLLAAVGLCVFAAAAGGSYRILNPGDDRSHGLAPTADSSSQHTTVTTSTPSPLAAATVSPVDASPTPTLSARAPRPAFTRADIGQPTIEEWVDAHDGMTTDEHDITADINRDLRDYLTTEWGLAEGAHVTFNEPAQTMFVTVGPSLTVAENGGDNTELIRSVMFAGCSYGNQELTTNLTWPYGRVVVVYQESMANPMIADYRVVTNSMRCRV
ncbi:serine/threonine-protein kinase [Streptomyces sp. NPDC059718]